MQRRQTLKLISALPLIAAFPSLARGESKATKKGEKTVTKPAPAAGKAAAPKNLLDEKDTLANAMQYKHDASQAGPVRADKKAFCNNCAKYNVCMDGDKSCKPLSKAELAKSDVAPCQIFQGKVVKAKGWCLSWSKA